MQRLQDHYCFEAPDAATETSTPLMAEREDGRPDLQKDTFRGQPVWFHQAATGLELQTDNGRSFSIDEAIACIQFEHYVAQIQPATRERGLRSLYYLLKPLLPRPLQLQLQRLNARRRLRQFTFPQWPQDATLTRLLELFLWAYMEKQGIEEIPFIGFWPHGKTWAWSLTHDVDTALGLRHVDALARVEENRGVTSSWFFVPERYRLPSDILQDLKRRGHEIGVHGVDHSGKLFENRKEFEWRRDRINDYLHEWQVRGFRSPATYRNPFWLTELEIDYDSSYMDVASLEPQPGGVCAPFPFMLDEARVEIPITLPMDHTLLNILKEDPLTACRSKSEWIRRQFGVAVALFHPDYNTRDQERQRYAALIDHLLEQGDAWPAQATAISTWWQARRHSRIERQQGKATIVGPAAESGRIWWARRQGADLRIDPRS